MSPRSRELMPVAFVAFQTDNRANGGITSLGHIVERLEGVAPLMITQLDTDVTRHWRERGYDVHCWPLPSPFPIHGAPPSSRARRGASIAGVNLRLRSLFREHGVRVVHCNDLPAMSIAAPAARTLGIPVVHNIRDTLGVQGVKWKLARLLSSRVVVLSREMRTIVEERLALPDWVSRFRAPIEVIYSGVDATRMRPLSTAERERLRADLGITRHEIAVGVVAAVVEKKQQRELLACLIREPSLLPEAARLYFIGDFSPGLYEYARACQELSRSPALQGRVRFVGYTAAVEHWYQSLDCSLIVSSQEGLARSMVESVACGTPVISFDVCSAREILDEHACGEVVRQGDFVELLQRVRRGIEYPEAWRAMAARGPSLARRLFSPEAVAAGYLRLYRELSPA